MKKRGLLVSVILVLAMIFGISKDVWAFNGGEIVAFPSTVSGNNANIQFMVEDSSGNIYAVGSFTSIDGVSANNIAMFDGVDWIDISGTNGDIYSLTIDASDNLYVSGNFTQAGSVSATGIAMYDGTWHTMGNMYSNESNSTGWFRTLAVDSNGNLYGYSNQLYSIDGVVMSAEEVATTAHVVKYDGENWSQVIFPTGYSPYNGHEVAADNAGNVFFQAAYDGMSGYVLKFDGADYTVIDLSISAIAAGATAWTVNVITPDNEGNVYIGGEAWDTDDYLGLWKYDGANVTPISLAESGFGTVSGISIGSDSSLFVAGWLGTYGDFVIRAFDGETWTTISTFTNSTYDWWKVFSIGDSIYIFDYDNATIFKYTLSTDSNGNATVTVEQGSLAVIPAIVDFGSHTLDGTKLSIDGTTNAWTIVDSTGSGAGYHVTIQSTDFLSSVGSHLLSVSNMQMGLLDSNISTVSGNDKPVTSISELITLSGSEQVVLLASAETGMGTYEFIPSFHLEIPASAYAGEYMAVTTLSIISGPN